MKALLFSPLACISCIFINKCCKHRSYVVNDSSNVIVGVSDVVVVGFDVKFDVSLNVVDGVVEVGFCYIRGGMRGRRENSKCFNGDCRVRLCVCGERYCE